MLEGETLRYPGDPSYPLIARAKLRDQLLFLGLIDLQDTVMGRKARNTGHKALRARAVVDLADYIGWDRAHGVFYTGVPDMAVGPLYYSLYDAACVTLTEAFPDHTGKNLKQTNKTKLTPEQVEDMVRLLMEADSQAVWDAITTQFRNGVSLRSLGTSHSERAIAATISARSSGSSRMSSVARFRTYGTASQKPPSEAGVNRPG